MPENLEEVLKFIEDKQTAALIDVYANIQALQKSVSEVQSCLKEITAVVNKDKG